MAHPDPYRRELRLGLAAGVQSWEREEGRVRGVMGYRIPLTLGLESRMQHHSSLTAQSGESCPSRRCLLLCTVS